MIWISLGMMAAALALSSLPGSMPRPLQFLLAVMFAAGLLGTLGALFASPELDMALGRVAGSVEGWASRQAPLVTFVLASLAAGVSMFGASRAVDEMLRQEPDGPLRHPGPHAAVAVAGLILLILVVQERL